MDNWSSTCKSRITGVVNLGLYLSSKSRITRITEEDSLSNKSMITEVICQRFNEYNKSRITGVCLGLLEKSV